MIFGIKEKWIILTHTMYCWLFATNIPVLLMTAFVLQGHIYSEQGLKLTLVKHQMRVTSAVGEFMKQCYSLGR